MTPTVKPAETLALALFALLWPPVADARLHSAPLPPAKARVARPGPDVRGTWRAWFCGGHYLWAFLPNGTYTALCVNYDDNCPGRPPARREGRWRHEGRVLVLTGIAIGDEDPAAWEMGEEMTYRVSLRRDGDWLRGQVLYDNGSWGGHEMEMTREPLP
jgi:hypothetical protein